MENKTRTITYNKITYEVLDEKRYKGVEDAFGTMSLKRLRDCMHTLTIPSLSLSRQIATARKRTCMISIHHYLETIRPVIPDASKRVRCETNGCELIVALGLLYPTIESLEELLAVDISS